MARIVLPLISVLTIYLYSQSSVAGDASVPSVVFADLGIRYTPPAGMVDKSTPAAEQARERANSYNARAAELLLDLSSGATDDKPEWHQIWIFHFPRAQLSGMSDWMAEAKMNNSLAGPNATGIGQPRNATFDGHSFLVSEFEREESPLTKHAKIFTTVCKTQLVSFVFVSNSVEQISGMEDSLKSLSFSGK